MWALAAESMAVNAHVVDYCVSKLDLGGRRGDRATTKSDGEAAINALKGAVATSRVWGDSFGGHAGA